jgi:Leucine-rich repeat (LRR) protein
MHEKMKKFAINKILETGEFVHPFKNIFDCFHSKITLELLNLIYINKINVISSVRKAYETRNSLIFLYNLKFNDNKYLTLIKPNENYCISDLIELSSSQWCNKNGAKLLKIQKIFFDNYFTHLPPEMCHLKNLTSIFFNNSKMNNLSPQIFLLEKLEHLSLRNNRITVIPSEIANLINLESLCLEDNQIASLPSEISQLSKLRHLSLEGNPLDHLPIEFFKLTNLTEITFSSNTFPEEIVEGIKSLLGKKILFGKNQHLTRIMTIEKWEDQLPNNILNSDFKATLS